MLSPLRCAPVRLAVSALLTVFWASPPAFGWVDKAVVSDAVTVDAERDGTAVVAHEILLSLRGGPLPEIVVEPVDADAALLPEATATAARSGVAAGYPLPLSATKDGERVRLHVLEGKGLRSGTYQLRFSYRTSLSSLGRITPGSGHTRLEWHGLRFENGMDAAKVVFRIPRGTVPPRLRGTSSTEGTADVADDETGVFLSTLRRGADKDELEVVRPHVAKGEGVQWSIVVDRATFDASPAPGVAAPEAPPPTRSPSTVAAAAPRRAPSPRAPLLASAVLALAYAGLLVWKSRALGPACRSRRAELRPLLPLPLAIRALLVALGVVLAVLSVVWFREPELASACFVLALAAQTFLPPCGAPQLRGPGKWEPRDPDSVFDAPDPRVPGRLRFVDAGHPLGFVLFVSLLGAFVAGAIIVMRTSPFHGVALALGASSLLPLFFTGRLAELPPDPVHGPVPLLSWLFDSLAADARFETTPRVRLPLGGALPDELRLVVTPRHAVPGFVAVEIGVEYRSFSLGHVGLPFVVVRVRDGQPAEDVLPKGLLWTRGRTPDERVAVLRPRFPSRRATLELVRDVAASFVATEPPRRQAGKSAARSSGSAARTEKAGATSSPAHAT